jgi:hypothetical protein
MIDVFCLNGEVGNITVGDDVVKVVLEFPNNERTWDELTYLFPVKKKLITSRIFAAVNRDYQPGRRRSERDEAGTPLLPGIDQREECHGCGKMVDTVNEPFYAKKGENGGKEIILCELCYRVPQPETIDPPPSAATEEPKGPDAMDVEKAGGEVEAAQPAEPEDPGCTEEDCGHPRSGHDEDGVCRVEDCRCIDFKRAESGEGK